MRLNEIHDVLVFFLFWRHNFLDSTHKREHFSVYSVYLSLNSSEPMGRCLYVFSDYTRMEGIQMSIMINFEVLSVIDDGSVNIIGLLLNNRFTSILVFDKLIDI